MSIITLIYKVDVKTIIAGSRHITDVDKVFTYLNSSLTPVTEVVCGCARGVDAIGKQWAESRNIPVEEFPADWQRYDKAAGSIRNGEMADYADALILIWDGESKGSADMLKRARRKRLRIEEFNVNNIQLM